MLSITGKSGLQMHRKEVIHVQTMVTSYAKKVDSILDFVVKQEMI